MYEPHMHSIVGMGGYRLSNWVPFARHFSLIIVSSLSKWDRIQARLRARLLIQHMDWYNADCSVAGKVQYILSNQLVCAVTDELT